MNSFSSLALSLSQPTLDGTAGRIDLVAWLTSPDDKCFLSSVQQLSTRLQISSILFPLFYLTRSLSLLHSCVFISWMDISISLFSQSFRLEVSGYNFFQFPTPTHLGCESPKSTILSQPPLCLSFSTDRQTYHISQYMPGHSISWKLHCMTGKKEESPDLQGLYTRRVHGQQNISNLQKERRKDASDTKK